jgi:hypothetical protein
MLILAITISAIAEMPNFAKNRYVKILSFIKNKGLGGNPAIMRTRVSIPK